MTLAELASDRLASSIEAIEAHPAGCRLHPVVKAIIIWNHAHLTYCATASAAIMQGMCQDELAIHGGVLFA